MSWFKSWFVDKPLDEYAARKAAYIEALDTRQTVFHTNLQGASQTEVILGLEARIYILEQQVKMLAKIPTLTNVVEPTTRLTEPVVKKPYRPRQPK